MGRCIVPDINEENMSFNAFAVISMVMLLFLWQTVMLDPVMAKEFNF